jgi:integrase
MTWSEQQSIEFHAPQYLKNVIRIITESGLRVYKELASMRKEQIDVANAVVFLPDSKTPNGVAEVPLTEAALEAFKSQIELAGPGPFLFPNQGSPTGYQLSFKRFGKGRCAKPASSISGCMIFGPHTPPGCLLGA